MINHDEDIYYLSIGILLDAFQKAQQASVDIFTYRLSKKVDHIISLVGSPLDKTLYQSQKAIENTKNVVKDNGTFPLISNCEGGIGNDNFYRRVKEFGAPALLLNSISFGTYEFGDHKAMYWAKFVQNNSLNYIGKLSKEIISNMFMKKISEEELLDLIKKWNEKGETIILDGLGGYNSLYLG